MVIPGIPLGKVMITLNWLYPSWRSAWDILIWGVETVKVALCFPDEDGLYGWSLEVEQERVNEPMFPLSFL